jgi:hypothetical protein
LCVDSCEVFICVVMLAIFYIALIVDLELSCHATVHRPEVRSSLAWYVIVPSRNFSSHLARVRPLPAIYRYTIKFIRVVEDPGFEMVLVDGETVGYRNTPSWQQLLPASTCVVCSRFLFQPSIGVLAAIHVKSAWHRYFDQMSISMHQHCKDVEIVEQESTTVRIFAKPSDYLRPARSI